MGIYNPLDPDFAFTLGIEEEYQIIDPQTRELRSHITQFLEHGQTYMREQVKAELHQSIVEVGTRPCRTISEARAELRHLRGSVAGLAVTNGLKIAAAGSHPFSSWMHQDITPFERYEELINEMQDAARQLLIFGMHCHIGMPSTDVAIEMMNIVRYLLPHFLALSSSSPFWMGRDTGFKSYRSVMFSHFPRTGIPPSFTSAAEFANYVHLLVQTGCIDNGKKIWWDLRPHPFFNTLEFRVCDVATRLEECLALAATMQAFVVKFYKLFEQNMTFRPYRRALINENKWRAQRWGLSGQLIDFGKRAEVDTKALVYEMVALVDDVVDDLGSRKEVEYLLHIAEHGSSADRQLQIYRETGDLQAVVDNLIAETLEGIDVLLPQTSEQD